MTKILPNDNLLEHEDQTDLVVPNVQEVDITFDTSFADNFPGVSMEKGSVAGNVAAFLKSVHRKSVSTAALVCNQMNIVHAAGSALDDIAALFRIRRFSNTATRTLVTFSGTVGTVVTAGTELTDGNDVLIFKTEDTVKIGEDGMASVYAYNTEKGSVEIDRDILTKLVVSNDNIKTVSNDVGETGRDEETDEQLRVRIYLQRYTGSALLESIRSGILSVDGVLSCYCEENKEDHYCATAAAGFPADGFLGFATSTPTTNSSSITVYAGKKTPQETSSTVSVTAENGQYVIFQFATEKKEKKVYQWDGTRWNLFQDVALLRPHSIWCVVFGGDESSVAKTIFQKKSSGSDYSTLGEGVSSKAGYDRSVNVADPVNGFSTDVKFTRPEEIPYSIEVDVIRHKFDAPDENLSDAIKNAIIQWQNGNVFGVDGLSVGETIYSYEVGAAISEKIPKIKIKNVSIVKIEAEIDEVFTVVAKCSEVDPNTGDRSYSTGTSYPVKFDGVMYIPYTYTGMTGDPMKNHLTFVGTDPDHEDAPVVEIKDIKPTEDLPGLSTSSLYVNLHKSDATHSYSQYTTLAAAWNDAEDGQIITQVKNDDAKSGDAYPNLSLTKAKSCIVDMNGHGTRKANVTLASGVKLTLCNNWTSTHRISGREKWANETSSNNNGYFRIKTVTVNGTLTVNGSNVVTDTTSNFNITGSGTLSVSSGYVRTSRINVSKFNLNFGKVMCEYVASATAKVKNGYLIATTQNEIFHPTSCKTVTVSGGFIEGKGHFGNAVALTGGAIVNVPGNTMSVYEQGISSTAGNLVKKTGETGYGYIAVATEQDSIKTPFCNVPGSEKIFRATTSSNGRVIVDNYYVDKNRKTIYYNSDETLNAVAYDEKGYDFSPYLVACSVSSSSLYGTKTRNQSAAITSVTRNGETVSVMRFGSGVTFEDAEIYRSVNNLPDKLDDDNHTYRFRLYATRTNGASPRKYPVQAGEASKDILYTVASLDGFTNASPLVATTSGEAESSDASVTGLSVTTNEWVTPFGLKYPKKDIRLTLKEPGEESNTYVAHTGVEGKSFNDTLAMKPYQIGSISESNIGIHMENE